MELNFRLPSVTDGDSIRRALYGASARFCEDTFGNMFCWQRDYKTEFCITDGALITGIPDAGRFHFPKGEGDMTDVITRLIDRYGKRLVLNCLTESEAEYLTRCFEGVFEITELTDRFDYIYESEKLINLTGKKLAAKRNHINAFVSDGEWHTQVMTRADLPAVRKFNEKWCENRCGMGSSLKSEMCAAARGIDNFSELHYDGLLLFKNGELTAYSMGERISRDFYCVHVEKADDSVRGAYQMINREFCRAFCTDVLYVNREDDAGDPGLRKAKLSYYPTELGRKFKAGIR